MATLLSHHLCPPLSSYATSTQPPSSASLRLQHATPLQGARRAASSSNSVAGRRANNDQQVINTCNVQLQEYARGRRVATSAIPVSGPGAISSPIIDSMTEKIKAALETEEVLVTDVRGDGQHVSIEVVSTLFEGKRALDRQRMVYKAIWEELQGAVHAVDSMITKTPNE